MTVVFKRVLVPLDGSRLSSRALPYAVEIASKFAAGIHLVRIVRPAIPVTASTGMTTSPAAVEVAMEGALIEDRRNAARARKYLKRKLRELRSARNNISYQVVIGDPARSIIDIANDDEIDLVVMTTHGASGLKRAIMGSVADRVIRESGKPVMVIRPQSAG